MWVREAKSRRDGEVKANPGIIRVGIVGWTYESWRGVFYPQGLKHEEELAYAASHLRTIEITGTFHGMQRPEAFESWTHQVSADFVFAVKGPRYITHILRLRDAQVPLANFIASGLLRLGIHLGPILWQLPSNFRFDRNRIELVNLAPPAIQAAVLNGDLPAGSVWQPFRYNLQQNLGDKVVQFNNDKIYTAYALLTVRREFAERNPEAIQAFLKALLQAERFVRENRSEAISILAGELNIDPKVLDAIWGEYDLAVGFDSALKPVFVEEGGWVRRSQKGFADKPVPSYDDVLDPSFLRAVDGSRVTTAGSSGH